MGSLALMSHVGKIMERMIKERLAFYMESRRILSPHQSGFRGGRGTMYPVMCLEQKLGKHKLIKISVMAGRKGT